MKSKSNLNYDVTTNYIYSNSEQEYVFCYRARPFAMLSSSHFPTPTSSYVDHRLVMELGMKITDIGCKKLSFAGKKLRMLGKVSFTAQCVKDGQIFGNFQFKASVIEDLKYHFDTHGIVGVKMKYLLGGGAADRIQSSPSSSTNRNLALDVTRKVASAINTQEHIMIVFDCIALCYEAMRCVKRINIDDGNPILVRLNWYYLQGKS